MNARLPLSTDPALYRPELHRVRRVTSYDFTVGGYRIKRGSYVAYNGAWDRKGVVTKVTVKAPEQKCFTAWRYQEGEITRQVAHVLVVEVAYCGSYFSRGASKRTIWRWDARRQRHVEPATQRFYGRDYVPAQKLSHTTFKLYVLKDGSIYNLNTRTGWNIVVPR